MYGCVHNIVPKFNMVQTNTITMIRKVTIYLILLNCVLGWAPHQQSCRRDALEKTLKISSAFLIGSAVPSISNAEEVDSDGYITTDRGLKYKVVKQPNDPNSQGPSRAQKVKAKYTLYLNGFPEDVGDKAVKIDSSSKPILGERPFEFLAGVSQVIKGWDLAIMDMKEGEARKLVINSDLGYGDLGAGGKIPGKATLYFDVELAEIGAMSKLGEEQYKWLEEHPL